MMWKMRVVLVAVGMVAGAAAAVPAEAQLGGRFTIEPYVGYAFFGELPETNATLEADVAFGGRAAFGFAPQWAAFASFQRSTPEVTGTLLGVLDGDLDVDQWSVGVEFSYVPRGGAEGMLPVILEAGLGQTRYQGGEEGFARPLESDLAANLGLASALRLSPNIAVRYGANDYISNYRDGDGIVNQVTVRIGVELRL